MSSQSTIYSPGAEIEAVSPSRSTRKVVAWIAAVSTAVAIGIVGVASQAGTDPAESRPAPTVDEATMTRDLVNRGLIPGETLHEAASAEATLRDLVAKGLVPSRALETETSADDVLRDLVSKGLIPAAALND